MAVQIGKYKRPGIFIEEIDRSVIESPTLIDTLSTLVVGFSRKGPVNSAVLLQNTSDLERVFGPLDRSLERKGSYFHRTISKMLESSPVIAVNLLATDDNLDRVNYKTLSTSTDRSNLVQRTAPYRRMFDTTGFWKRDEESFMNYAKSNQSDYTKQLLSFTNFSDRTISVFVTKSALAGFDRTLLEWYGTIENMPRYVNINEWASDYMIDVIVVSGDWSNYRELSADPRWSSYFNIEGIKKTELRNFANDRNVNLLAYYEGLSLIPYFRDANGRNIFVESVINNETDRTGLFCAFDNDQIEKDFPTGCIDLIGNNLVGSEHPTVDFLSYNETLVENLSYSEVYLDRPGNVLALCGTYSLLRNFPDRETRGAHNGDGFLYDFYQGATPSSILGSNSFDLEYTSSGDGFAIFSTTKVDISLGYTYSITSEDLTDGTYSQVFFINSSGEFKTLRGSTEPQVSPTDIVLSWVRYGVVGGTFSSELELNPVTVNVDGFVELEHGVSGDYYITSGGTDNKTLTVLFNGIQGTIPTNQYVKYRKLKTFNSLVAFLDSSENEKGTMLVNSSYDKLSLSNVSVQNIVRTQNQNKSFQLQLPDSATTFMTSGVLVIYKIDDELILGEKGFETKTSVSDTEELGVVGRYSKFYNNYYDGSINSGDYFNPNILSGTISYQFIDSDVDILQITGAPVEMIAGAKFRIPESLNDSVFTIISASGSDMFILDIDVVDDQGVAKYIQDADTKHYLKLYLSDSSNNESLVCKFTDNVDTELPLEDLDMNTDFFPWSRRGNFDQTIDIELPTGWVENPNKILVNPNRFSELTVGDFLESDWENDTYEVGQQPRKLTRILSKRRWALDGTYTEITCDTKIKKKAVNGDFISKRYSSIDKYASTFKAITLGGFKVREASMPDGTEARQNQILNILAKGTPLFKALTNKESIDFRYLVDSFGLGLTENSKQQLADICGERLDAFGILNAPSIKSFRNSVAPSFSDSEGIVQTSFIAQGANPEVAAPFLFNFAQGRGTTSVGYFTPYVVIDDNGRVTTIPPAMFVATSYLRKSTTTNSNITPWTVVAGVTNGRVLGINDLEIDFSLSDIENLNGAKFNPIVFKRNRGFLIETENTAQTQFVSALSYIHVREVLIELERELSNMLLDFQWKFNTPDIRAEIKLRADVICETYVNRVGLYNYFNKCDEENNTPDIIDNQIGVLDTYVEPIKAMGIIVNNVTILRTGAIQSGGFIVS